MTNASDAAAGVVMRTSDAGVPAAPARTWQELSLRERLLILRRGRHRMAAAAEELAGAISPDLRRTQADTLVSEVLPLLDACRFLERNAEHILAPRHPGRNGRPAWMSGVQTSIERAPWGHVLVIGPANFPLFLAGAQTLQALAAGNRVTWKPGRGGEPVAQIVLRVLREAGMPDGALRVSTDTVAASEKALEEGADLVVFTGSGEVGRNVLAKLAATATPSIMELSGCDAVVVLPSADVKQVAKALTFALELNGGEVCMRPRRIVGSVATVEALRRLLSPSTERPVYIVAESEVDILHAIAEDAHGLTVSVFHGNRERDKARRIGAKVSAGVVLYNDLIAPTADPRAPFGGRGASGFGVTRGAEGLLAMTTPKVSYTRSAHSKARHFAKTTAGHVPFFNAWIRAAHGASWSERARGVLALVRSARAVQEKEEK